MVINQENTEAPATWARVAIFGDKAEELARKLTKGAEVYCEGRLSLGTWTGKEGDVKTGLSLVACEVQPMGQIGHRRPKAPKQQGQAQGPSDDSLPF